MSNLASLVDTRALLERLLAQRILVLDGAMGTMLQGESLTEDDFRGDRFPDPEEPLRGFFEALDLTRPERIEDIHRAYLEAGADIIETDTFNGTAVCLSKFGLEEHVFELNQRRRRAGPPARPTSSPRATPTSPGSSPAASARRSKQLSIGIDVDDPGRRDVTFDEMVAGYNEQIEGLVAGGVDILLRRDLLRHAGPEGVPVRHRRSSSRRPARGCR